MMPKYCQRRTGLMEGNSSDGIRIFDISKVHLQIAISWLYSKYDRCIIYPAKYFMKVCIVGMKFLVYSV